MGTISYKELGAPIVEPVSLAQAKSQCVVDTGFTTDDSLIQSLIVAARQFAEKKMQRAIFNRPMQMNLDFFPFPDFSSTLNPNDRHCLYGHWWHQLAIKLPKPATQSVQSITYIDLSGETQTLSNTLYYVDTNSEPARIVPMPGLYWPYTQVYLPGSVQVKFIAGTHNWLYTDTLAVVDSDSTYTVTLSQADALDAGTLLLTSAVNLVDAESNPVAYTAVNNVLTVNSAYAGQTLTATYYAGTCPQTICQAMLLLISYWYNHRDSAESNPPKAIEQGVDALLAGEMFDTFGLIA